MSPVRCGILPSAYLCIASSPRRTDPLSSGIRCPSMVGNLSVKSVIKLHNLVIVHHYIFLLYVASIHHSPPISSSPPCPHHLSIPVLDDHDDDAHHLPGSTRRRRRSTPSAYIRCATLLHTIVLIRQYSGGATVNNHFFGHSC